MNKVIQALISFTMLLCAISGAITTVIFISGPIYSFSINWFNLTTISGLTHEALMDNYYVILQYLINPTINQLSMPYFSMSLGGAQHFEEVKVLFFINFILLLILLILTVWFIRIIRKNHWQIEMAPLFSLKMIFPLILLFFIVIAFDKVFVIFHQLLFNNELWLFNPLEDPVITVLPQEFFMILFVIALLIYEVIILGIRTVVYWNKKR